MDWTATETRLKHRLRSLGSFVSDTGSARLKDAVLSSLQMIRDRHDWDWKYATSSLATTAGNKGPYDAPADFARFATQQQVYYWTRWDRTFRLKPILDTDTNSWDVYYSVQEDKLYFAEDPGTATLTLNYLADLDWDDADIATTITPFPNALFPALALLVRGDLQGDQTNLLKESQATMAAGLQLVDSYWSEVSVGRYGRKINPMGINNTNYDMLGSSPSLRRHLFRRVDPEQ